LKHLYLTSTVVCLVLLSAQAVHAQTSANFFQSPGDSDHADALVSNFAGLGFGTPFQLTLDSQFDFTDSGLQTQSDLNTSVKLLDTLAVGVGYTFNRDARSLPLRMGLSLSDSESWSIGLRTYTRGAQRLTELATMLRPANWVSLGLSLSELVHGSWFNHQSWKAPRLTSGITIRPLGKNHRLGVYQMFDEDFESSVVGLQWFSRIWNRWEVGVSTEHRAALSQRLAVISLRTLGNLSLGAAAGWRSSEETAHSQLNLSARIRARSRPSRRAGSRATIATIEIAADSEYGVSGWLTPVAHAPFLASLQTLDALSRRDDLDGVLIKLGGFNGGWAQCEELKNAIIKLKKSQKRVYIFLPFADMRLYSVAAFADEIITTPTGGYDLTGASMSAIHIKGLLDRVGVEAEFVTTGADKTAPETFTRSTPSPASIASQNNIVDTIFTLARDDIALGRAISVEKVDEWIAHGIHSGQMLKKHKLVDHQLHLDQAERYLTRTFSGKTRIVNAHKFLNRRSGTWGSPKQIAVLFIVGSIIDGQTPTNLFSQGEATGSTTFRTALRRLVSDAQIAGIVIRIDSPGGTISASDTMWRAIRRARRKKPIVISFSNVAASGGYYAAVGAKPIYASERTLTGSIGVFAGKFNFSTLLRKWGVLMASFNRGPHAGIFSMSEPWSTEQRKTMQESIDEYDRIFQSRVKDGRPLEATTIKTLAGGRVYMGSQALEHKLVDNIGGIGEAILDLKARLSMPQDLSNLVIAPSSDDSSRVFSLPRLGGSNSGSIWSSLRPYLKAIDPQFERLVSLVYTLRQGNAFALMPTIWHHN
jgi:signal peptide peptidase SppA